ncbi:MAG TPA: murein biosynthesis integral membrane protein MurJ [Sedimentisphaerales bacterium]|nr:murein biosynthesis integral membrane protein MurJ [Sedimentisphaerales bacterium]
MVRGFRQIVSLTAVSRVLGFVRDMTYSHFFGANALLDAWTIAFKIPNLSRRLFGEGAASASFIPVYSQQLHENPANAKQLVNTVLTVLFVILAALVIIGEAGIWLYRWLFNVSGESSLALSLCSIMLPYMLLVCIVAMLGGVLNVHRHFAAPAAAPIVLNIFIIAAVLLTGWAFEIQPRRQLFFVAFAVIIAGIMQIVLQMPPLKAAGVSVRPAWRIYSHGFKTIITLMGPMILGLTATQINTLADDLIAWGLSASPEKGTFFMLMGQKIAYPLARGSVSHLYFAQRLYQLPLGLFGISLATAIFPVMSSLSAKKDFAGLTSTISRGLCNTLFIAIPATVGMAAVARPLISLAFQHGRFTLNDTDMVTLTLFFYVLGLCGYFLQQIITRAFYSLQDSKAPMKTALVAVFANIILNLVLVWFWGTGGLALSTAICSYLQVFILIFVLKKQLAKFGAAAADLQTFFPVLARAAAKTAVATIVMSAVIIAALWLSRTWPDVLKLLLIVPSAALSYIVAAKLLRIEMLSLLTGTADKQPVP